MCPAMDERDDAHDPAEHAVGDLLLGGRVEEHDRQALAERALERGALSVRGFDNQQEAISRCSTLRGKGGKCFVRSTAGDSPVQLASR